MVGHEPVVRVAYEAISNERSAEADVQRVEETLDFDGSARQAKRQAKNERRREERQAPYFSSAYMTRQTVERPAWMDDPSLLPKRPPGATK